MIGRVARQAADRFGDRSCYVTEDGWTLSYRDLDRLADEVAAGLAARHVGTGDVVALVLPTIPEYVIAYVAAARLGAVTAGVNVRLTLPERAALLAAVRPKAVVATPGAVPDGIDLPGSRLTVIEPASQTERACLPLRVVGGTVAEVADDGERPLAIVFTSGTTGLPKGAVFGGRQLEFITDVDTMWRWGAPDDPPAHTLAATSFAHLGPMTKLPGTLVRGGTTHLLRTWRAADALRLVAEHRMAGFGGIPTQVALMLRHPDFERHDVSCVQAIVMGGGPATPALIRQARQRFGAAVSVRYSCTEAGIGVGTAFDDPPEDAEVSVGRPHAGVEVAIVGATGTPLPDGEEGEICLRSPAVMSGYWHDGAGTAAAFTADGYVRTGDLGWVDEPGRLRLSGRAKEMYVRGGYNVFPQQVEAVLSGHPGVADVAVIPRPDDVMGEIGVAVIVPSGGAPPTLDELRAFAAERLAAHKLPEALLVVEALPLTPMDKVDRRTLATSVAELG